MYSLVIKQFIRNNGVKIGLFLLLFCGVLSLIVGKQFVAKQAQAVAETAQYQQEHIDRNVKYHSGEMGLLLYYLRFGLVNETNPLTALTIGQRDVNASVQSLTIRGLENQKYDTDLNNALNLLLGNLDFSFVLIYLFPLLIIAFTYNILSEEKEVGTWRLVAAQTPSVLGYLLKNYG